MACLFIRSRIHNDNQHHSRRFSFYIHNNYFLLIPLKNAKGILWCEKLCLLPFCVATNYSVYNSPETLNMSCLQCKKKDNNYHRKKILMLSRWQIKVFCQKSHFNLSGKRFWWLETSYDRKLFYFLFQIYIFGE